MTDETRLLVHTPPRLSDLPLDQRRSACVERAEAARDAWLDQYRNPRPSLLARIVGVFRRG